MKSDLIDIEVIFQTQTEKAVCVRSDEASKEDIWIPKSLCQVDGHLREPPWRGDQVTLTAPQKVLEEKGLV